MKTYSVSFLHALCLLKTSLSLILGCLLFALSSPISAHTITETIAQVILRDGQVEVRLTTDIKQLSSTLQDSEAWLLGDIEKVMPDDLSIEQQQSFVKNALQQKTKLVINQQAITFERAVMTDSRDSQHRDIVFQAQHSFPKVSELSISFHPALGAVHVSFVKPQYQRVNAGKAAHATF